MQKSSSKAKNRWKCIFGASRKVSFSYFFESWQLHHPPVAFSKSPKIHNVSIIFKVKTYFALYSIVNIAEFEQINSGWAETVVSDFRQ